MAHRPEQTIAFRKAGTSDAEAIAVLHLLVRRASMPYVPELHTLEETVAYFRNAIGAHTIVVAEASAKMIGYCAFRPEWIDHLYVDPAYHGRSVGSRLLERATAQSERLQLWVFQKNVDATRFYERHGFKRIRTTDGADNEEREPDALYEWRR